MKYSAKAVGTEMGRIEQQRNRQQEAAFARYQSARKAAGMTNEDIDRWEDRTQVRRDSGVVRSIGQSLKANPIEALAGALEAAGFCDEEALEEAEVLAEFLREAGFKIVPNNR